jgi:hypothetical protein
VVAYTIGVVVVRCVCVCVCMCVCVCVCVCEQGATALQGEQSTTPQQLHIENETQNTSLTTYIASSDVDRVQRSHHQRNLDAADDTDTMASAHQAGQIATQVVGLVETRIHGHVVGQLRGGGRVLHEGDLRVLCGQLFGGHLESGTGRDDERISGVDQLQERLTARLAVEFGHVHLHRGQHGVRMRRGHTVAAEFVLYGRAGECQRSG